MEKCYFKVPDEQIRKNSLGSLPGTSFKVKKSLQTILPYFSPITAPKPSDWLWDHQEQGQSFDAYKGQMHNQVDQKRNIIYILPLEKDIPDYFMSRLKDYCSAFFLTVKVQIMKPVDVQKMTVQKRINEYTGKIQYNASQILKEMEKKISKNAFCIIGVLLGDLYPRDQWNFVFGLASIKNRTGVFSFARYDQQFFEKENYVPNFDKIFYRSIKVMTHQIGHMFGMRHCIYYNCLMNGSNHLEQNLKKPMQLCPICLRKLQSNIKFDILQRYMRIRQQMDKQQHDQMVVNTKSILDEIITKLQIVFKNFK